jgi:hypothetical protein
MTATVRSLTRCCVNALTRPPACYAGSDLLNRAGKFGPRCRWERWHKATPIAFALIRTSPGFGSGMGTSMHCSTLGGPGS